ncbi:mycothiol synthase [Citricoccus sp. SGAir0253]|uniref:mycothiol synthase n=1 Tax=Citricoccus sp. SGAir0253 TaxID=2567881 RepID=UPI0010CD56D0|nr:mycothiol synthase [Citricoccus sp. SGAir0253]QCU77433.1 mycothiol synthase [Citricoccus sp. SGAir0253]
MESPHPSAPAPDTPEAPELTVTTGRLEPGLLRDLRALAEAAEAADGNPPFSDQTWVELRAAEDPERVRTVTAWLDHAPGREGELAGAAVAVLPEPGAGPGAPGVLELVVHPNCRCQGVATAMARELSAQPAPAPLQAWAHGSHAAAARLAEQFGYAPVRELLRLRLTHHSPEDPVWREDVPAGVTIRAFVPGRDDAAWLAANAAAFAHHPEQGSLDQADLDARKAEPWFDPAGFLLAVDGAGELLGFHWTKVHPGVDGHAPLGEVYVIGIVPSAQGRGLGRVLTVAGIRHLQRRGVDAVMLYVDADNTAAVELYRKLGFTRWDTDVMYAPSR